MRCVPALSLPIVQSSKGNACWDKLFRVDALSCTWFYNLVADISDFATGQQTVSVLAVNVYFPRADLDAAHRRYQPVALLCSQQTHHPRQHLFFNEFVSVCSFVTPVILKLQHTRFLSL